MKPTKKQLEAILIKYKQNPDGADTYREFRKRFQLNSLMGCMLGEWRGMVLGIEPDGYAHS